MKHRKKVISIFVLVAVVVVLLYGIMGGKAGEPGELRHASTEENSRVLIVYYSYTGTTERVAEKIQEMTHGDLYDVQPARTYSGDSNLATARLMWERFTHNMPELSGELPDLSDYDTILIGTPVWNNDIANPVMSYLEQNDFEGKTVAPFWTYAGSAGNTADNFVELAESAVHAEGLGLSGAAGYSDEQLEVRLSDWLEKFMVSP